MIGRKLKKLITKTFLVGALLGAMLSAALVLGCTDNTGTEGGRDGDLPTASQSVSEEGGGESGGEHGGGGEGSESGGEGTEGVGESGSGGEGSGGEGSEGSGSGEEGSANMLTPDETFDMVRGGARLIMRYDAPSNTFKGTVENTTNNILRQVRIEVHLSNGVELGPTTPTSIAPGEVLTITLPAAQASFTGWVAHAEVGGGGEGSESGGEHGSGGESGGEGSEGGGEESGGEHGSCGESGGEHGGGESRGGG